MRLPFTLEAEDFNFRASEHIAKRNDLTEIEKELVSTVDIMDQRSRRAVECTIVNRWWLIVLTAVYLVTNGRDALHVALQWAGVSQ